MLNFRIQCPELVVAIQTSLADISHELQQANELAKRQVIATDRQTAVVSKQVKLLEQIAELYRRQCRPARPQRVNVKPAGEVMDKLTYEISVDGAGSPDVVKRVLSVSIDAGDAVVTEFAPGSTDLGKIEVPQDSSVLLSVVDVDDAGNESAPLSYGFVARDTIAPETPAGLNVKLTGESAG